jgi:hypothetical protein
MHLPHKPQKYNATFISYIDAYFSSLCTSVFHAVRSAAVIVIASAGS